MRVVCEADITCSALKVDDTADADALLEKAAEALKAAGHEEKTAARERRLAECTGTSDVDEGRRLLVAPPSPFCRKFPWMPMCTRRNVCSWCMSVKMSLLLRDAIKEREERAKQAAQNPACFRGSCGKQ